MKTILYSHSGSGNHGCEALVRSTAKILSSANLVKESYLFSYFSGEDRFYGIDKIINHIEENSYKRGSFEYYVRALFYKVGCKHVLDNLKHKDLFNIVRKGDLCLAIGGDSYTYDGWPELLAYVNHQLKKREAKTVLWGCSISEELVKNEAFLEDMRSFDLITVREPISYKLFTDAGIKDNVVLVSDSAFELDITDYDINHNFKNNNSIVGLNLSPLSISCESLNNSTLNNYRTLVKHILADTDYNIALIPHVIWNGNDDRITLQTLYDEFRCDRIVMIPDMDCTQLKGAIGKCRFFIGARTHATIAAYSQFVPTLVVGYSLKAKGIAESLFGTQKNYVLPVQDLKTDTDLTQAFEWLRDNEKEIINYLHNVMPAYKQQCYAGIARLGEIVGK